MNVVINKQHPIIGNKPVKFIQLIPCARGAILQLGQGKLPLLTAD